ncbi:hypothetical protein EDEG_03723 [Edhazardia aedis USNM 41457]|uniref:Brix domain-containing protein n=1 Tax=Edhazardia aedis (strain USNM 41457) TaxID=1003232 RepID=J9D1N8_EDHAE|nr:hypothetical protein EDEG_03723 [Edhazardia aedis USNM 41457]|eukprot:EJW01756.1 hypothetical protein EDEG_03723 [Edhazardia aedis USNM 41457]
MTNTNCLVTTSKEASNKKTLTLVSELSKIIPNSTVNPRDPHNVVVKVIEQKGNPFSIQISANKNVSAEFCTNSIGDIINNSDVEENRSYVEFRIVEYRSMQQLNNKADPSSHLYPELVFNNFTTDLSSKIFEYISLVFPIVSTNLGNRVASFVAKNDFIYFRLYRYVFESRDNVQFQDVGPHLTLRLRKVVDKDGVNILNYSKLVYEGNNIVL